MASDVEKLIVELDAKFDKYIKDVKKAGDETANTEKSMVSMGIKGAKSVAAVAVAALAAAAALSAFVVNAGKTARESQILASQAKLTVQEFNALSFATKQYGIDAEKTADISKDLADRLGEFATAGSGAFQDFADVTRLTKEEAIELAEGWKDLSSDQVLGQMVKRMEEAGASGNDMTFVMESMAGDLSRLTPLFINNGSELKKLTGDYNKATEALALTKGEAEALQESAAKFDLLTDQLGKAGSKIAGTIAPVINGFFESILDVVPHATQAMINFINSFLSAKDITSNAGLEQQISAAKEEIKEIEGLRNAQQALINSASEFGVLEVVDSKQPLVESLNSDIDSLQDRIDALSSELESRQKSQEDEKLTAPDEGSGGTIGGGNLGETADESEARQAQIDAKLQQLADANEDEFALIQIKADRELEILTELGASKEELRQADLALQESVKEQELVIIEGFINDVVAAEKEADDNAAILANKEKARKQTALSAQKGFVQAAGILNSALLEDNKAINAGLIVADTAVGIQKALASAPYPLNFANAAIVAATGVANLANNASASRGGGSISGAPVAPAGGSQQEPVFSGNLSVDETTQDFDGLSSGTIGLEFSAGSSDELGEVMADLINRAVENGKTVGGV